MIVVRYILSVLILLFGLFAIVGSPKKSWVKLLLIFLFVIVVLANVFLDVLRDKQQIDALRSQTRPYLELSKPDIAVNLKTFEFTIPVRNYGHSLAENVTLVITSEQTHFNTLLRSENLPPKDIHKFKFIPFHSPTPGTDWGDELIQLLRQVTERKKGLVFDITGFYEWAGERFEMPKRTCLLYGGNLTINVSETASMNNQDRSDLDSYFTQ